LRRLGAELAYAADRETAREAAEKIAALVAPPPPSLETVAQAIEPLTAVCAQLALRIARLETAVSALPRRDPDLLQKREPRVFADDEIGRLMEAEGLDFLEAVTKLAAERGFPVERPSAEVIEMQAAKPAAAPGPYPPRDLGAAPRPHIGRRRKPHEVSPERKAADAAEIQRHIEEKGVVKCPARFVAETSSR
jgi:hypothetical protein